ncbi:protein adenylyltransferase SelO family protein [Qipengyuania sp. DGS5-3]|uniref:protein adenylyltransferase SelO family protein n=1 Tax=Qipengyuania sp. DGS5-3 TaxID=3349632 RepID=UPI0036D31E15
MRSEPQATSYRADTPISDLAEWLGDPVTAANFPKTELRFRNDRWARAVGLDHLSDAQWTKHFGRFEPLPDNLPQPLALRYHGHQFRNYNPDLGDGRGFLFAQLRDSDDRLLDLGTKGSGQTPWSRRGDGRLTLKGAVREVLATEWLEALGVYTSKTFSIVETGEELERDDEPSPARSAVLTRLSHGHIRIGSFQRLLAYEQAEEMAQLVDYCLSQFPGPPPPEDAPGRDEPAVILMHQVVERLADQAAAMMVAGFVHGVLNTDNMNITGECFDYGPWRFLPRWDPSFTAAYFDHAGLYAFGRQPEALHWNCGQLAVALRLLADAPPLIAALERFGQLYMEAVGRRWCWRLGLEPRGLDADMSLVGACEEAMRESGAVPDRFFHRHRGGRSVTGALAKAFSGYDSHTEPHSYWEQGEVFSLLVDDVEAIWEGIDRHNDWTGFNSAIEKVRKIAGAHGEALLPFGHLTDRG